MSAEDSYDPAAALFDLRAIGFRVQMADLPGQPRRKSRRKKKGAHVPGSIGGIIPDKEIEQERERIEPKLRKLPDDAPEDLAEKLFGNLPRGPRV